MHGRAPITIADRNGEHDRPMPIDDQADGVSEAIALVATINRQAAEQGAEIVAMIRLGERLCAAYRSLQWLQRNERQIKAALARGVSNAAR